jgi:hypothetical protein
MRQTESVLRFPSACFGVATIFAIFLVGLLHVFV